MPAASQARRAGPRPPGAPRCAGAAAGRPAAGRRSSRSTSAAQARRVVDVAGAVGRGQDVAAGLDARVPQRAVVRAGARLEEQRDVDHHVADDLDRARRRRSAREVVGRRVCDGHSSSAERWSVEDAVELLGHRGGRTSACPPRRARPGRPPARRPGRRPASSSCRRRRAPRPGARPRAAGRARRACARSARCWCPPPRPSS